MTIKAEHINDVSHAFWPKSEFAKTCHNKDLPILELAVEHRLEYAEDVQLTMAENPGSSLHLILRCGCEFNLEERIAIDELQRALKSDTLSSVTVVFPPKAPVEIPDFPIDAVPETTRADIDQKVKKWFLAPGTEERTTEFIRTMLGGTDAELLALVRKIRAGK